MKRYLMDIHMNTNCSMGKPFVDRNMGKHCVEQDLLTAD